jgi:hypothetical protein
MPLMMLPWRDLVNEQVTDIRARYGITPTNPPGHWTWTTAISEDPRPEHAHMAMAAE